MRRLRLLIAAGALFLALTATSVEATPPDDVLIEVDVTVTPDETSVGTFTATGPVCSSGRTADVFVQFAGFQSERRVQMLVGREFTCDDGTGTFLLLVRVHAQFEEPGSSVFVHPIPKSWSVLSGTGDFEQLHGSGSGSGTPTEDGFTDALTGRVHTEHQELRRS